MASTAVRMVSALLTSRSSLTGCSRLHDQVDALAAAQRGVSSSNPTHPISSIGRVAVEQRLERDLALDAGQAGAEAEVHAPAERQVPDLAVVVTSKRAGSSKRSGSWFAAVRLSITNWSSAMSMPAITVGSRAMRDVNVIGGS